jgi:ATP-dependent Lhr-like helicase
LAEITQAAIGAGYLAQPIRVTVRTGDTPMADRQQMLRRPPHILITTPESLYLLLTATRSRKILETVHTVIIDEIHAVAPTSAATISRFPWKRLRRAYGEAAVRMGLSATQRPIEAVADFLVGNRTRPTIVDIATGEKWICRSRCERRTGCGRTELDLERHFTTGLPHSFSEHRSTLVFVNTRRLVERVSLHLDGTPQGNACAEAVARITAAFRGRIGCLLKNV